MFLCWLLGHYWEHHGKMIAYDPNRQRYTYRHRCCARCQNKQVEYGYWQDIGLTYAHPNVTFEEKSKWEDMINSYTPLAVPLPATPRWTRMPMGMGMPMVEQEKEKKEKPKLYRSIDDPWE